MKGKFLVFLAVCALVIPARSFAQEDTSAKGMDNTTQEEQGWVGGKMWNKMKDKGMMGAMCPMMGARTMVAVENGAVVVLFGNKLMKYDKDLNLVKETEIKVDMQKMMENCPMSGKTK